MTTSDTDFIRSAMPLCASLGVEADTVSPERVVLRLDWRPELCTSGGLLHGGVADGARRLGRWCVRVRQPARGRDAARRRSSRRRTSSARSRTAPSIATATPLHVGSMTIVIETEVRHDDRLVAKVTQTQAVLR